jgi:hypothetical protein
LTGAANARELRALLVTVVEGSADPATASRRVESRFPLAAAAPPADVEAARRAALDAVDARCRASLAAAVAAEEEDSNAKQRAAGRPPGTASPHAVPRAATSHSPPHSPTPTSTTAAAENHQPPPGARPSVGAASVASISSASTAASGVSRVAGEARLERRDSTDLKIAETRERFDAMRKRIDEERRAREARAAAARTSEPQAVPADGDKSGDADKSGGADKSGDDGEGGPRVDGDEARVGGGAAAAADIAAAAAPQNDDEDDTVSSSSASISAPSTDDADASGGRKKAGSGQSDDDSSEDDARWFAGGDDNANANANANADANASANANAHDNDDDNDKSENASSADRSAGGTAHAPPPQTLEEKLAAVESEMRAKEAATALRASQGGPRGSTAASLRLTAAAGAAAAGASTASTGDADSTAAEVGSTGPDAASLFRFPAPPGGSVGGPGDDPAPRGGVAAAPRMSVDSARAQVENARLREKLIAGGTFLKHGRSGAPHKKVVYCSDDLSEILWRDLKKSKPSGSIPVSTITAVAAGQTTLIFARRKGKPNREPFSFSLLAEDRTLDVECDSVGERGEWIRAFEWLISQRS